MIGDEIEISVTIHIADIEGQSVDGIERLARDEGRDDVQRH